MFGIEPISFRLTFELNSTEGDNWREKLPNDQNDHERYVNYFKSINNYSEENSYQCHLAHAEQLYLDACYILAIWFYTICIELRPEIKEGYLKRAACYLKVFEVGKYLRRYAFNLPFHIATKSDQ